ncbi:pentatricopeptide repeat-containing protein [Canna indica]|uniref:Pentatricopeptide repeat-containing protein n=1 Tax=Canna indica TaxID=4628 RepID=A0AAQ3JSY9_9LILI|nr:pentatricopeptide repeat-containing protein [Canna indica]
MTPLNSSKLIGAEVYPLDHLLTKASLKFESMKKPVFPLPPFSSSFVTTPTFLRLFSSHFASTAGASAAPATPTAVGRDSDSSEAETDRFCFPSIIQDKDLLLKSPTAENGLLVLDLINSGSLEPSVSFYSLLVKRCTRFKRLKEGRLVHAHFMRSEFKPDIFLWNSIVNMYCKCGSLDDARKAFDEMPVRDMVTWTALLTGYAQNDRPNEAVEMLPGMLRLGLMPNEFTFASLFKACGAASGAGHGEEIHALSVKCGCSRDVYVGSAILDMYTRRGMMEEACLVFDRLDSKNEVSWNALIAGYARREDIETAIKKFCEMQRRGFEATHFTYSSVFSACAGMGALEQGKWVHAHMIKSGQKLTAFVGNTILDIWTDAATVRKMMKQSGVKKEPACSWVEMENSIHMFVANDNSHPQIKEIHKMWEKVDAKIKEAGYVPDTNYVLLHVDEHEREEKLQYHCEKLALAFALLNMPPGAPIRIMKNIRMCGDCHSAIKHVSKVMEREIIVRDTNRFHHFNGGTCSCGDYW